MAISPGFQLIQRVRREAVNIFLHKEILEESQVSKKTQVAA